MASTFDRDWDVHPHSFSLRPLHLIACIMLVFGTLSSLTYLLIRCSQFRHFAFTGASLSVAAEQSSRQRLTTAATGRLSRLTSLYWSRWLLSRDQVLQRNCALTRFQHDRWLTRCLRTILLNVESVSETSANSVMTLSIRTNRRRHQLWSADPVSIYRSWILDMRCQELKLYKWEQRVNVRSLFFTHTIANDWNYTSVNSCECFIRKFVSVCRLGEFWKDLDN